jgi:hypothetical protein
VRCFDKHAPRLAQRLRLWENIQTHFCLRRVKSPTLVCKLSNQAPSICIGDSSTSTRRSRKHGIASVNEGYRKDDVLRCRVGRGVLERGINEVIGTQGIPVDAVIKVRNGKGFLIRRYRRTASVYQSEERGQYAEAVDLTFYTSAGGCAS